MGAVSPAVVELREQMDKLRGRLFQRIESFGLEPKHESACKGVIRQTTYDAQAEIESKLRGES
jgi:hypothetical protein